MQPTTPSVSTRVHRRGMSADERREILDRYNAHAQRFAAIAERATPTAVLPFVRAFQAPTSRERQILAMVADGLTNKEIAAQLFLAEDTVKTHIKRILPRIGARNRAHAVAISIRRQWIQSDAAAA